MRIKFEMHGGFAYFPGLNTPLEIDTEHLESQQASQIESMINKVCFFDLPEQPSTPAPGAADFRTFIITVDDGQKSHMVQVSEPVENAALQELIDYFQVLLRSVKKQPQ
jgi:hypothetical protein